MSSGTSGFGAAAGAGAAVATDAPPFAASAFFLAAASMAEIALSLTPAVLRAINACTEVSKFESEDSIAAIVVDSSKPPLTICTTSSLVSGFPDCPKAGLQISSRTAISGNANLTRMLLLPRSILSGLRDSHPGTNLEPWTRGDAVANETACKRGQGAKLLRGLYLNR